MHGGVECTIKPEMSLCDSYRELELYLEQAENEISRVFENGAITNELRDVPPKIVIDKQIEPKADEDNEKNELDPFLVKFNATIRSDLSEIMSRYRHLECKSTTNESDQIIPNQKSDHGEIEWDIKKKSRPRGQYDNIYTDLSHDLTKKKFIENEALYTTTTSSYESLINAFNLNELNSIHAATQTSPSPSLSPISSNLTWTSSESSSSPCLTSQSDSDLIDEDTQSLSSIDGIGKEQQLSYHLSTMKNQYQHQQILGIKSSSAPVLKKMPIKVSKQARSQSDRHLTEIEAAEACKWLRATGFPQYAQMYEDMQFPIDISTVTQDHPFLETDVLNSLFRRLKTLNSCAHLHQQRITHSQTDESEDELCALSDNWTYQKDIRRWSRTCTSDLPLLGDKTGEGTVHTPNQEKDDVFEQCVKTESPKERLRRAGSTKFRRLRKDNLNNTKNLDSLSQELNDLKYSEVNHVSDSECTPKHSRRSRTKSFDTTDPWCSPQITNDRVLWEKLPQQEDSSPEQCFNVENSGGPPLRSLSCTQLQVLRKLALLKLTSHMEKYCPSHRTGWNWDLPKLIRKIKTPVYKDKSVFGVPLTITLQRTGQSLPRNIEEALVWLQQNANDQVGLFRKSGVKSRIQTLRNMVETSSDILNYNDQQSYDVADMVKQYFRDLPETMLTNKLSETFIIIFQYVPPHLHREAVLCAILLMPDEHVEVLQSLLNFLLQIAQHAPTNQMNESNLALCFAPSLFHHSQITYKQNSSGTPHQRELAETKAGHECLLYLLKNFDTLFKVPKEFVNQSKTSEFKESKTVKLCELGRGMGGWKMYLNESQTALFREAKDRGWMIVSGHNPKVEISYKKVADGHPLRLWRAATEVEAPPSEVLHRIIRERHIWDPELLSAKIVSQIEKNYEVFQYARRSIAPLLNEEYCVVRTWRADLPRDGCLIVETSIEHKDALPIPQTMRGIVLASRYLIEPCGSGRSRLIHLSRIDMIIPNANKSQAKRVSVYYPPHDDSGDNSPPNAIPHTPPPILVI